MYEGFCFPIGNEYSFAVVGLGKNHYRVFTSRNAAKEYMFKLCKKHGLVISSVWRDGHHKTYNCGNGIQFHINKI